MRNIKKRISGLLYHHHDLCAVRVNTNSGHDCLVVRMSGLLYHHHDLCAVRVTADSGHDCLVVRITVSPPRSLCCESHY